MIAGAKAERVTASSWESLVERIIFTPLGMATGGFGSAGTPGMVDPPWPHYADGTPLQSNGPAADNPAMVGPAGSVHCSIGDWSKFVVDELHGMEGRAARLPPGFYAQLFAPPFGGNHACGWLVLTREWGGGTVFSHAGSDTRNFALAWLAPRRDLAVLACTNQGGPDAEHACHEAAVALINYAVSRRPR